MRFRFHCEPREQDNVGDVSKIRVAILEAHTSDQCDLCMSAGKLGVAAAYRVLDATVCRKHIARTLDAAHKLTSIADANTDRVAFLNKARYRQDRERLFGPDAAPRSLRAHLIGKAP
jgi:hypothetical protein